MNAASCSPDAATGAAELAYVRKHGLLNGKVNNAALSGVTVFVIKSHAIAEGVHGKVVQDVLDAGLEISCLGLRRLSPPDAADFMEIYKGVLPECDAVVRDMATGAVLVLEVRAENAVQIGRELCGPYDPDIAKTLRPETLRARYGHDRVRNAVHCTDLPEAGPSDSEFMFRLLKAD